MFYFDLRGPFLFVVSAIKNIFVSLYYNDIRMHGREGLKRTTLLLGSTLTVMAGAIIAPALPEISRVYEHLPRAELLSKLILTLPALFIALLGPLAGYFIDRNGRRKVLLFSLFLYALAGTTGAYLSNIYLILAGRAFLGMAVGAMMTAIVTLIGDYYEGKARSTFMGYQAAFSSTGGLVFISTGGFLADYHWRFPFLIYAVSLIILFMAWLSVNEPVRQRSLEQIRLPGKAFFRSIPRQVFWVYALAFFSFAVFYMIPVQMPFMLSALEGTTNTQVGIAIATMNITAMLTAFNYARFKKRMKFTSVMALVYALIAAGYIIISQSGTYGLMVTGIMISGLGFGMQMANINLWLVELAPPGIRGTLVGYLNTFIFLGMFASPVLLQPLVSLSSLYTSFFLVAIILLLTGTLLVYSDRRNAWDVSTSDLGADR